MTSAMSWGESIQGRATWLFFVLATISMVWTFSQLLFHRSSLAEFFGETIRFMMFTGFFLWLLRKGPVMAIAIIVSLERIGRTASNNQGNAISPSGIIDIGFDLLNRSCAAFSALSPFIGIAGILLSVVILAILALVGVNMLLQLCTAWVLAYAGIFFLGFGGSRWTSDMAINYFKSVLSVGISLMTMTLLVGVGSNILSEYHGKLTDTQNLPEFGALLVVSITLLMLVGKLPAMVAGIINGAGIGSSGIGSFGAGAAVGAAMTAASFAQKAGSIAASATKSAATMGGGIASAIKAAGASAGQAMQQGTGAFSGQQGSGGSGLSLGKAMGTTASFATEVGKSLGQSAGNAVKEKASNVMDSMKAKKDNFMEGVGNSTGGKMASAINEQAAQQQTSQTSVAQKIMDLITQQQESKDSAQAEAYLDFSLGKERQDASQAEAYVAFAMENSSLTGEKK